MSTGRGKEADPLDGSESFVIRQLGRSRWLPMSLLIAWIKQMVPGGDKGDKGDAGPQGVPGADGRDGAAGLKGEKGDPGDAGLKGDQGIKGDAGSKGDQGVKGDTGPAGAPKRVERFTGTTNASGLATIPFSPEFAATPDIQIITGWATDQMITGSVTAQSATGCTVTVKVSRGTLALSSGPFQAAGAGVSITVRAIGN